MRNLAHVLRIAGVVLTSLFAGLGILFAAGYAFEDPGGWQAVAVLASMVVPLAALTWGARKHPAAALRWVLVGVGLLFAYVVAEVFVDLLDAPVLPLAALVLSVPAAVLGLRNARRGGELLLLIAASPALAMVLRLVASRGPEGEGPSLGDALGWSTGIVVLPLLCFSALFLLAAALDPRRPGADGGTGIEAAPRSPSGAAR
jgi:hypothetical protein